MAEVPRSRPCGPTQVRAGLRLGSFTIHEVKRTPQLAEDARFELANADALPAFQAGPVQPLRANPPCCLVPCAPGAPGRYLSCGSAWRP
jgi:hypothetical protein